MPTERIGGATVSTEHCTLQQDTHAHTYLPGSGGLDCLTGCDVTGS